MDFTATADQFDDGLGLVPLNGNFRQTASDFDATQAEPEQSGRACAWRVEWSRFDRCNQVPRIPLDPFKFDPDFSPITGNTGVNYWVQSQWSEELRVRPISPSQINGTGTRDFSFHHGQ